MAVVMSSKLPYVPSTPGIPRQETAQEKYFGQPHDCFIDITPYLHDPFGSHIRLGTVRYRVPWDLAGGMQNGIQQLFPAKLFNGHPNSGMSVGIEFEVEVTWADAPQPETLTEQQVVAENPGMKYDYPGLRHGEKLVRTSQDIL